MQGKTNVEKMLHRKEAKSFGRDVHEQWLNRPRVFHCQRTTVELSPISLMSFPPVSNRPTLSTSQYKTIQNLRKIDTNILVEKEVTEAN